MQGSMTVVGGGNAVVDKIPQQQGLQHRPFIFADCVVAGRCAGDASNQCVLVCGVVVHVPGSTLEAARVWLSP